MQLAQHMGTTAPTYAHRLFSGTHTTLGKKKKSKKTRNGANEYGTDEATEELDTKQLLKDASKEFKRSIESYNREATELKMGKSNPEIFNDLKVQLSNKKSANFKNVAQTSIKGSKLLNVTVFDPNDTKHVVSAILGANLNLNPIVDPKNPQLLKVHLPNTTKELREKQFKRLKELTDDYKSSHSNKNSLTFLRNKYMRQVKSAEGSEDVLRRLEDSIEKVYKGNAEELVKNFKKISKGMK